MQTVKQEQETAIIMKQKQTTYEQCKTHDLPLTYFCETCTQAICSDCAMFQESHRNHSFKHIKDVYGQHVNIVKKELPSLHKRLHSLKISINELEDNIEAVTKSKEKVRGVWFTKLCYCY